MQCLKVKVHLSGENPEIDRSTIINEVFFKEADTSPTSFRGVQKSEQISGKFSPTPSWFEYSLLLPFFFLTKLADVQMIRYICLEP